MDKRSVLTKAVLYSVPTGVLTAIFCTLGSADAHAEPKNTAGTPSAPQTSGSANAAEHRIDNAEKNKQALTAGSERAAEHRREKAERQEEEATRKGSRQTSGSANAAERRQQNREKKAAAVKQSSGNDSSANAAEHHQKNDEEKERQAAGIRARSQGRHEAVAAEKKRKQRQKEEADEHASVGGLPPAPGAKRLVGPNLVREVDPATGETLVNGYRLRKNAPPESELLPKLREKLAGSTPGRCGPGVDCDDARATIVARDIGELCMDGIFSGPQVRCSKEFEKELAATSLSGKQPEPDKVDAKLWETALTSAVGNLGAAKGATLGSRTSTPGSVKVPTARTTDRKASRPDPATSETGSVPSTTAAGQGTPALPQSAAPPKVVSAVPATQIPRSGRTTSSRTRTTSASPSPGTTRRVGSGESGVPARSGGAGEGHAGMPSSRQGEGGHAAQRDLPRRWRDFNRPGGEASEPAIHLKSVDPRIARQLLRRQYPELKQINSRNFWTRKPFHRTNCTRCVVAVERALTYRGLPVTAGKRPESLKKIADRLGGRWEPTTGYDDVIRRMRAAGEGARGVVAIIRRGQQQGHVFNVVHDRNGIVFLDGQDGRLAWLEPGVVSVSLLRYK
ncbi:toxin glutamine deamidase domain-containing protein [Amycolatopsis sp. NEAU-NG30]|uniref:Toxin glutamine deamidase domain-containing protein n=1 Tax=Amycolatopsis melonis TaxID=3156488 RepID=A0ABV0LJ18_9PSEU